MFAAARISTYRILSISALAIAMVIVSACIPDGAWDMIRAAVAAPDWNGTMGISIDTSGVNGYLFDVPVPIRLNSDRIRYDLVNADGTDIAFYDSPYEPGSTPLDHERSLWNPEGESVFWVRLPVVSSRSSSTIYVHAGSKTVSVEERPAEV
ncbi:MAG: hypothetical protein ACOCY8_01890 [Spirochaetota bacterium]